MIAKYCEDCRYSTVPMSDTHPAYVCNPQCTNDLVNAASAWSLASIPKKGKSCIDERREEGFWGFGVVCGLKGKLFELKEVKLSGPY